MPEPTCSVEVLMDWDTQLRWRKYIEIKLNRLGAEVGGNAGFQAERVTAIMDEIDGLRKDLTALSNSVGGLPERIERMAEFLTELKKERKNGGE